MQTIQNNMQCFCIIWELIKDHFKNRVVIVTGRCSKNGLGYSFYSEPKLITNTGT